MPAVETARGVIWYEDHRGGGTPVLMIHGAGGSHLHFPSELRTLPEADAVIPDLPGHGSSAAPGRNNIADYAADMIALLDTLSISQVITFGHSMGGAIAQTLALYHPARVRGLILIGTGAKLTVHPDILGRLMTDFPQAAKTIIDWEWSQHADIDQRDALGYKTLIGTPAEIVFDDYFACNQFDIRARLSEIRVPTLIIGGEIDRMTPQRFSEYLHQHIIGSTLVTVKDGSHMMALEQSTMVLKTVHKWLGTVKGTTCST